MFNRCACIYTSCKYCRDVPYTQTVDDDASGNYGFQSVGYFSWATVAFSFATLIGCSRFVKIGNILEHLWNEKDNLDIKEDKFY